TALSSLSLHDALPICLLRILFELLARQAQRILRVGLVEQRGVEREPAVGVGRPDQPRAGQVAPRAAVVAVAFGLEARRVDARARSEEHTSELQSREKR